jgi:hypothetical protein
MKKIVLALMMLVLPVALAHADIFSPVGQSTKTTTTAPVLVNENVVLTDVTAIINYLGVKEGTAYNFKLSQMDTTTGATIVTYAPLGLSADVEMLNADGVAGVVAWNVGNYLPVANVPVIKYFSYLYLDAGYGWEENIAGTKFEGSPILGAEFKFSF